MPQNPTIKPLKYGNTNTFFISGQKGILIDTDWAGTLPAFFKKIKRSDIRISDIGYLLITHYHPDHMGISGELIQLGVKLLVVDVQREFIHSSDEILRRSGAEFVPIDEKSGAVFVSCAESREFLRRIGIDGEIIHTPGHSDDSISLILDGGAAFVGDLPPIDVADGYDDDTIRKSRDLIMSYSPKVVYYGHANERRF